MTTEQLKIGRRTRYLGKMYVFMDSVRLSAALRTAGRGLFDVYIFVVFWSFISYEPFGGPQGGPALYPRVLIMIKL